MLLKTTGTGDIFKMLSMITDKSKEKKTQTGVVRVKRTRNCASMNLISVLLLLTISCAAPLTKFLGEVDFSGSIYLKVSIRRTR